MKTVLYYLNRQTFSKILLGSTLSIPNFKIPSMQEIKLARKTRLVKISVRGTFFAGKFYATVIFLLGRKILRWRIFRPENSSPENSSPGRFFARSILRRIILRSKKILEAENSSQGATDIFSLGRKILRRIVLHRKVLRSDDS
jgi:hypothetical protein